MDRLLRTIGEPRAIRQLPLEQLGALSQELKEHLAATLAMPPELLSSALGVVDLTLALHYVYDFSQDHLIFDVAHQSCAHVALGDAARHERGERRPVPARGEEREPYDHFFSSHAGASISKAMGLAAGSDRGEKTVAVIGDGAIVSGVALEALNAGGESERDVLVILNDNEMSISKVVGAMGEYLSKIRVGKTYNELKKDAHKLLQRVPFIGETLEKAAEQMKDAVTKALVPGHLFESLGPRYFGPVDGHNIAHLVQLLREIRRQEGFYLLHVVTRREPALEAALDAAALPEVLEAPLEFARQGELSYAAALRQSIDELAEQSEDLVLVTAAPPDLAQLSRFEEAFAARFPERIYRTGISEQHGFAFAAGLAAAGKRPLVLTVAGHQYRAYDQIAEDIASAERGVVICLLMAGVNEASSALAHELRDVAGLRSLPGLRIAAPRDASELRAMLELANDDESPWVLRVPPSFSPHPDQEYPLRGELLVGKSEILRRGGDVAVFAYGSMVYPMMEAAETLAEKGLEASIINARFAAPVDADLLAKMLDEHSLVFSLEEHSFTGGLGAALLDCAAKKNLEASRLRLIGAPDRAPRGSRSEVLRALGLDIEGIADRILVDYRRYVRS